MGELVWGVMSINERSTLFGAVLAKHEGTEISFCLWIFADCLGIRAWSFFPCLAMLKLWLRRILHQFGKEWLLLITMEINQSSDSHNVFCSRYLSCRSCLFEQSTILLIFPLTSLSFHVQSIHHWVVESLIPVYLSSSHRNLDTSLFIIESSKSWYHSFHRLGPNHYLPPSSPFLAQLSKILNFFLSCYNLILKTDLPPFLTLNRHIDLVSLLTFEPTQELCLLAEEQPMYRKGQAGP